MTSTPPDHFHAAGPLPTDGLHVLEASAGTGKTHTIAGLCRRYIAEGKAEIGQLLVMTFGRSATQELRDRVRRELQACSQQTTDATERLLLQRALADFDSAGIMTIHEFCTDAFSRFGIRADTDPGEQVAEDLSDVVADASSDTYLAQFWQAPPVATPDAGGKPRTSPLGAWAVERLAGTLQANPDAELITVPETPLDPEQQRIDFALGFRAGVEHAKHRSRTISFDDMVIRLRQAVQQDPAVRAALRTRFAAVLVDEFQDTDPSQWAIVRDTFVVPRPGDTTTPAVILIGDPKQGIYAFRGADVHSYTSARATTGAQTRTLGTNFRSDGPVVRGLLGLFGGLELGDGIVVGEVAADQESTRITGPAMDADGRRVRLRLCRGPQDADAESMRQIIAADVANEIARTLNEGALIGGRPVAPQDFAVIVRKNKEAETVRTALAAVGIPAVVNSQVSVFMSAGAGAWLTLLNAMEHTTGARVRAAALTPFFGTDPTTLADGAGDSAAVVAQHIRVLAALFEEQGVPAVLARALGGLPDTDGATRAMSARLLTRPDGERILTDLRHVAALLHQEQRQAGLALTGLTDWLAMQVADANDEGLERSEALTRRLDSDAAAVQVVTIHRCKGLQYGIAYVPFGTSFTPPSDPAVVCTTDLGSDPLRPRRVIDVRSYNTGSSVEAKKSQTMKLKEIREREALAEELRMLYVAVTRGIHEIVLTWATPKSSDKSPLHRVLSAESGAPAACYPLNPPPRDKADRSGWVKVEEVEYERPDRPVRWSPDQPASTRVLEVAPYGRNDIDTAWARASFTGLTKEKKRLPAELMDDNAIEEKDDEPQVAVPEGSPPAAGGVDAPSGFNGLPAGTAFGTLVHAVLEHVDTSVLDLAAEVRLRCREQLAIRPMRGATEDTLADGLLPVLRTSLGRLAPGTTLADVPPADRLPELTFELPLHQGAGVASKVATIGGVLARATDEPAWVRAYGEALQQARFSWKQLRGYLTGSIDAVLRVDGRFLVVDYKSNRLGGPEGRLSDYRPEILPAVMAEAHYPLQALLYSVALHRFLRLRLPDYTSRDHLAGILYLFVRGMTGPETPVDAAGDPCGVFSWRPSDALVEALSGLLGGERT